MVTNKLFCKNLLEFIKYTIHLKKVFGKTPAIAPRSLTSHRKIYKSLY